MLSNDASLRDFANAARRYCAFVEQGGVSTLRERVQRARELLAELVLTGSRLPLGDATGPDVEESSLDTPAWPGFADFEIYWEVFDPYEQAVPVAGSLSDDLLDVYRDVRRGLRAYDTGQVSSAAWEWRFHFENHWGEHATGALRALHRACTQLGICG